MRAFGRSLLVAVTVLAPTLAIAAPKTPTKASCVAAHEEAQSLRTKKKLHAAREKYVECAANECPVVLRKECAEQLAQVESDAPTVTYEALDENGSPVIDVKVAVDGEVTSQKLTGTAVPIEPGEHVFKFERLDGTTLEQRVLVAEGDKNRKITADFGTLRKPKKIESPIRKPEEKPISPLVWVAGGVSLAALGSFTFFAINGKNEEKKLAGECSPNCTDDDVSPVKTKYLVADISLVVALAAGAAAVILALPSISTASFGTAKLGPAPWMPKVKIAGASAQAGTP